jgi:putative hydrolase of the HAD superfamily
VPEISAIISDFGGVLTTPLLGAFERFAAESGISLEELGKGMAGLTDEHAANPLHELETGRLSERDFLAGLSRQIGALRGEPVSLSDFGRRYFAGLAPNEPMIAYLRTLRERGYRMGLCTNNVREWAPLWRAMLPVQEIFDVVVDSALVGFRKPEPEIYQLTLQQLGVGPGQALFIDDVEVNCLAARELGLSAVWFQDAEQAVAEAEDLLTQTPAR